MKKCGIYKIISPTGKIYIGQSVDIEKRFSSYRTLNCKDQSKIYNSLNKYGAINHVFEVLVCCDELDLNKLEIYYIEKFDSQKNGLNYQKGGQVQPYKKATYNKFDNTIVISINHELLWEISGNENYKFSKDGKCFNSKRNKELKRVLVGGSIGYCINGKFQSLTQLRSKLIKIKESDCPF